MDKLLSLETMATRVHELWMEWASSIMITETLSSARVARWKALMIPYNELSEQEKEKDREVVKRVILKN
jgi:hypothetical protein